MHEMTIAQNIVGIVQQTLKEHPDKSCKTVYVKIGELNAVITESLSFAYKALTANTDLASSDLVIEHLPILGKCRQCASVFGIDSFEFSCPQCRSHDIEIEQGKELHVEKLELV